MKWGPEIQRPGRKSEPMVSACLRQSKSGTVSLHVAFSKGLVVGLRNALRANVSRGLAEDADKMRVTFGASGNFGVIKANTGMVRIILPVPEGISDDLLYPTTRCELIEHNDTQVIFALPLKEWREMAKGAKAA